MKCLKTFSFVFIFPLMLIYTSYVSGQKLCTKGCSHMNENQPYYATQDFQSGLVVCVRPDKWQGNYCDASHVAFSEQNYYSYKNGKDGNDKVCKAVGDFVVFVKSRCKPACTDKTKFPQGPMFRFGSNVDEPLTMKHKLGKCVAPGY